MVNMKKVYIRLYTKNDCCFSLQHKLISKVVCKLYSSPSTRLAGEQVTIKRWLAYNCIPSYTAEISIKYLATVMWFSPLSFRRFIIFTFPTRSTTKFKPLMAGKKAFVSIQTKLLKFIIPLYKNVKINCPLTFKSVFKHI